MKHQDVIASQITGEKTLSEKQHSFLVERLYCHAIETKKAI